MFKKKVLFLHHGGEMLRGSELCLLSLLEGFERERIESILFCNSQVLYRAALDKGLKAYRFAIPEITIDGKDTKIEIFRYIRQFVRLYMTARNLHIDLIYSSSGLPTQLGYPVSRILCVPIVTHIHAFHPKRYPWMWFFKFSDKVIFVSRAIRDDMLTKVKFGGDTPVIYNGIDVDGRFVPPQKKDEEVRARLHIGNDDIVLGQVGSLIHLKGGDITIKSFAKIMGEVAGVRLVFIGEGKEREAWVALAERLGVSKNVLFLGGTPNPENYYRNLIDININASRWEALGTTIIESAACGLPNLVSRVGGSSEIVDDGENGLLFEKENVDDLANKLLLLIRDNNLRERMGICGRNIAVSRFSIDKYCNLIIKELFHYLKNENN